MRTTVRTMLATGTLIVALAVTMTGCALYEKTVNPIFGETATERTHVWAERVFLSFNKGWIPALSFYRNELPECGPGVKAPCWEAEVYADLHAATDAATACQVAATAPGVDIISLQSCIDRVSAAKLKFTQNGISPVGGAL